MQIKWIAGVALAFAAGLFARYLLDGHALSVASPTESPAYAGVDNKVDIAGIEELHQLDVRVTLLNDPKALQQEWSRNAVRLMQDGPVDVGKAAIYASDIHSMAAEPGSTIVSYKPDIRDVRIAGEWAFEWGYFDAEFRDGADKPTSWMHGRLLRVLHREDRRWKFARVMVAWNANDHPKAG